MYKTLLLLLLAIGLSVSVFATSLHIENVRVVYRPDITPNQTSVLFDIRWENAWRNTKNHDAVWVFMKFNGYYNNHVKLAARGHRIVQNRVGGALQPEIEVSADGLGFFLYAGKEYRGDVNLKLEIILDASQTIDNPKVRDNFRVHGIEMVHIPEGGFSLGSPDKAAVEKSCILSL